MKKSIYITLALAGILSMNSCNDDEFLPGNPSMEIKAENADALFGDSLPFTIKASDVDVPLSTLKAQLFYGEDVYKRQTATNLLTWTSYSGMDPEVNQWGNSGTVQGIDWGTYPHSRSYVFGINVEF